MQYVQWVRTTQKDEMLPLDERPSYLRTVTADIDKQQAVVEAFRVSCLPRSLHLRPSVCESF